MPEPTAPFAPAWSPPGGRWPRISIVTPSFNQAPFLREAIESVLSQGYPNLEYIVMDGGSTDGSREIIASYADRLTWWCSEKDGGHADALNKGFARSTGEIMAWLNSDDKYLPWTFRTLAEIFTRFREVDWLMGLAAGWNSRGGLFYAQRVRINRLDYLTHRYRWIQQESTFWRRSLWEKAGGRICGDYQLMVDGELWCRFFRHSQPVFMETVLGGYRVTGQNRAKAAMPLCHVEMRRAIAALRSEWTGPESQATISLLHRALRSRHPLARWAQKRFARLCPPYRLAAEYPILIFEDGDYQLLRSIR